MLFLDEIHEHSHHGLARLIEDLGVSVALPAVRSEVVAGARRTRHANGKIVEQYPRSYARDGLAGQLRFAMRYEPLDLSVLQAVFSVMDAGIIEEWVRKELHWGAGTPRLVFIRNADVQAADLPDVAFTGNVDLLNPGDPCHGSSERNPAPANQR